MKLFEGLTQYDKNNVATEVSTRVKPEICVHNDYSISDSVYFSRFYFLHSSRNRKCFENVFFPQTKKLLIEINLNSHGLSHTCVQIHCREAESKDRDESFDHEAGPCTDSHQE